MWKEELRRFQVRVEGTSFALPRSKTQSSPNRPDGNPGSGHGHHSARCVVASRLRSAALKTELGTLAGKGTKITVFPDFDDHIHVQAA